MQELHAVYIILSVDNTEQARSGCWAQQHSQSATLDMSPTSDQHFNKGSEPEISTMQIYVKWLSY